MLPNRTKILPARNLNVRPKWRKASIWNQCHIYHPSQTYATRAGIYFYYGKRVGEVHGSLSDDLRTWYLYGDHPYFECRIHIFTIKRQDNWRHGAINLLLIHLFVPLLMQHGGKYDINVQ